MPNPMNRVVRPFRPRLVLTLLALAGAGAALWQAGQAWARWRFERWCVMTCPPFWDAAGIDALRAAMDWRTPLVLAAAMAALAMAAAAMAWRAGRASASRP
jgi:hypothetical protein